MAARRFERSIAPFLMAGTIVVFAIGQSQAQPVNPVPPPPGPPAVNPSTPNPVPLAPVKPISPVTPGGSATVPGSQLSVPPVSATPRERAAPEATKPAASET